MIEPAFAAPNSMLTTEQMQPICVVISPPSRPICWEHGCNGREFSTFSNLLRHQREKSDTNAKAECPRCGALFTRTTARNNHVEGRRCKGPGGHEVDGAMRYCIPFTS